MCVSEQWLYCKSTHKIQRSSCPFMWVQVLLRADLASQWPSAFQSCRALLYLRIRRCLAEPLCCFGLLSERESRFGACRSLPSLSVCLSTCQSLSHALCTRLSSLLFVFTSPLSPVFLLQPLQICSQGRIITLFKLNRRVIYALCASLCAQRYFKAVISMHFLKEKKSIVT